MTKKARRTEKQQFMKEYAAVMQEEYEERMRQQLIEAEAEEAYFRLQLQREEEEAYERNLLAEATRRREEDSREAYVEWLLDHPGFDPYGDLVDSSNERWHDYWEEDSWY